MMKITALSFLLLMIFISPMRAQGGEQGNAASPKDQEKPEVIDNAGQMTDTQAGSSKHVSIDAFELDEVNVVGNTPIGTIGLGQNKVSGNVQTYEDEEINRHESILFPDFLNRRLESVNINDVQNNPYQPDITYRGFEASRLHRSLGRRLEFRSIRTG